MESPEGTVKIASPLVGRHNVYNILAAAGACIAAGIKPPRLHRASPDA